MCSLQSLLQSQHRFSIGLLVHVIFMYGVIEGCYSDLLELLLTEASEVVFMNLPIEQCVENAKNRPWEPHKYTTKAAQDENLGMLIDWIKAYHNRDDVFSLAAHQSVYSAFTGKKTEHKCNIANLI